MIFLTGPPLNLLSVGWKVTDFKKTLESQTSRLAPPNDRKKSKCLMILIRRRFRGGPVEGFTGGASLEKFSGEAQLKKSPCISVDHSCSLVPTDIVCFILSIDSSRANQVSANLYQMLKLRKPPLALVGPKPNFFRISEMGAPFKLFIECLGIVGVQALVTCIMEFIID